MKRRILVLSIVAISLLLSLPLHADAKQADAKEGTNKPIVILTIDYGDGAQKRFPEIPWRKTTTVHDALSWAAKHPRGIDLVGRGSGETRFITRIDDLKNNNAEGKNWVYRVNDKLGDKSCAVFTVRASDRILWRFERNK